MSASLVALHFSCMIDVVATRSINMIGGQLAQSILTDAVTNVPKGQQGDKPIIREKELRDLVVAIVIDVLKVIADRSRKDPHLR